MGKNLLREQSVPPSEAPAFFSDQEITSAQRPVPSINMRREAPLGARYYGGIKMTPEGRAGLLESGHPAAGGYSPGQVVTDAAGKIYIFDPEKNEYFPYDRPGFTAGDIADFSGVGLQALIELPAATVKGAAGLGLLGSAARQGASALLPGDDQMSLTERGEHAGLSSALGGGTQGIANRAAGLFDYLRPHNIVARQAQKAAGTPIARQGGQLRQRTGIEYTFGQETGSRGALTAEGLARRHPASADFVFKQDQKRLTQAQQYLARQLDSLSAGRTSSAATGGAISRAYDRTLDAALTLRRRAARSDFRLVDAATGGVPIIPSGPFIKTLDDLIARYDVPGGGDATAALVNKLKGVRKAYVEVKRGADGKPMIGPDGKPLETYKEMTGQQVERLLEVYGAAAAGKGNVFLDIPKSQQQMVAGQVVDALMTQLDDALQISQAAPVAHAIRGARNNYRINSQPIDELRKSVIGRYLKVDYDRAPERVAEQLLKMRGTELKATMDVLERYDPLVAQNAKRYMVETAFESAGLPASRRPIGGANFSPSKFITELEKSPVWDTLTRAERVEWGRAIQGLQRLADVGDTAGSPTAPLQFAWEAAKATYGGMAAASPTQIGQAVASIFVPGKLARALMTPEGRRMMTALKTTNPDSKRWMGAVAYLSTLPSIEESPADVRPSTGFDEALANYGQRGGQNLLK